jgi:Flp pilus assembly protein protease CpaA
MRIIGTVAIVCSIISLAFAVWWAYVTALHNDQHKIIAFCLVASVATLSVLLCILFYRASRLLAARGTAPTALNVVTPTPSGQ